MKQFSAKEQQDIETVIKKAGANLLTSQNLDILHQKYTNDLSSVVTQMDIDTENFLKKELENLFPAFGFYSEETFKNSKTELDKKYVWVVDPIDGTLNFSRGLPLYGISVALMHQNKPIFGAVYFPVLHEYYSAIKYGGAFVNSTQISVRHGKPQGRLFGAVEIYLNQFQQFIKVASQNNLEFTENYCAVFAYTQTAAGRYDFALSLGLALWDIAAGWIILEEAGGVFEIFYKDEKKKKSGNPYYLWSIAGDKPVVEQIIKEVKQTWL